MTLRKTRVGLRKCSDCRKQFTVKVGTVFESAHIPLHKTLQAVYLMCSSKKGVSARIRLHRILGVTYKTAWFLCHRIREALRDGSLAPMGGPGSIVEVDETFIGRKPGVEARRGWVNHKHVVLTLVERGGSARRSTSKRQQSEFIPIVHANLDRETPCHDRRSARYSPAWRRFR